jgi:hypothetical protein
MGEMGKNVGKSCGECAKSVKSARLAKLANRAKTTAGY